MLPIVVESRLFNQWMDNYIANPKEFATEWQAVVAHLKEKDNGEEPSYGDVCIAYLMNLGCEKVNVPQT